MLRSAFAGLALRRSSASLRLLPSCQPAVSFSDNTTAGRRPAEESNKESPRREEESNQEESNKESPGASAEESNEESPGANDKKKAITKRKATQERFSNLDNRSMTSSRAVDDFTDLYMMMHLLNEVDDCRHDISRSQGTKPAAAVTVPPDHLDKDEPPVVVQGSSTEPAGATTAEDSSPATTDSSSCTAESSSPSASGDSSCSGGWWESGNSWGWGDSSYSGSDGDFSGYSSD